jgi:hypothetical protein
MIDTILIRLSNVNNYPTTKLRFEQTSKTGQTVVNIDEDSGEVFTGGSVRALLHHDTDNLIPLTKRNSVHVPSSNYQLLYKYNVVEGYVEFEFSIPKYLYGTNILQFIRYYGQDSETQYSYLMNFIKTFIDKMTYDVIDMRDVSIRRIDLCYNQMFACKYDALRYLDEQKGLQVKYARSTKNDYRNYETSLQYTTKRYSFKIYHKGTEFAKHDKLKLADSNPTGEHIDVLQESADRTLRYEVTIRKAQIDYLFRERQLYNPYVSFFFNERSRQSFRLLNPSYYKQIIKFCERGHEYVCAPVSQDRAINNYTVHYSKHVFDECYKFFWDYVGKYQLQCKMSVVDVMQKIDDKNEIASKIGDKALRDKQRFNRTALTLLALLSQTYSLDSLRKSGLIPKSTFYQYQSDLKELGYTSHGKLTDVAPPGLDYMEYLLAFGKHHRR